MKITTVILLIALFVMLLVFANASLGNLPVGHNPIVMAYNTLTAVFPQ